MSTKTRREARERWTQDRIATATKFVACMFLGRGSYDRREALDLAEAEEVAKAMLAEYGETNYRRDVLIYAITREGLSIPAATVDYRRRRQTV